MHKTNINYFWSHLIVEEFVRCGIDYFCIAPGSRSSPLAISAARHPKVKTCVHFDERGLAFHAMGYAAATKKAAVVICTSGTAVANMFPAVIEASKKKLPIIIISADRPPELRQTGAVQTIDQVKIFGNYVKHFADLPCPDAAIDPAYVLTSVDQAVYQAQGSMPGVVHLNMMFREPLAPTIDKSPIKELLNGLKLWEKSLKPYTSYHAPVVDTIRDFTLIASDVNKVKNGIIVVGKIGGALEQQAVLKLATKLSWPIFADISSGLRLGCSDKHIIHYFDHLLLSPKVKRHLSSVDGVIHLGGRMTSKRFYEWVAFKKPPVYITVLNHPLRNDPNHLVSRRVHAPVSVFVDALMMSVKKRQASSLLRHLSLYNEQAHDFIEHSLMETGMLTEPLAARLISSMVPQGQGLFLSNSMPIRDMDFYGNYEGHSIIVNGNRGASGIDGIIASAAGFSQGLKLPVTVMVGDVAGLHDLNSLAMLKNLKQPLIIVVLNNGGGAIFSFLAIAKEEDIFEKLFGTPHSYTFANAASMFELNYAQPQSPESFTKAYAQALSSDTSSIIEVMTSRKDNAIFHKALQEQLVRAIK